MILKKQGPTCYPHIHLYRRNTGTDQFVTFSSTTLRQTPTPLDDTTVPIDVIGASDILDGTLIALILAFTASFLQGRRNQNDFLLPEVLSNKNTTSSTTVVGDDDSVLSGNNTFDADSWKEMSRPESYIFYNQKLRERVSKSSTESSFKSEQAFVLVALLVLFVPIFSVEFFFALSRQLLCGGDPMNQSEWSEFLCSPAVTNFE